MLYYEFKINFVPTEQSNPEDKTSTHIHRLDNRERNKQLNSEVATLNEKQDYNVRFYISDIREDHMSLCGVIGYKNNKKAIKMAEKFAQDLGFKVTSIEGGEIKAKDFACLIRKSETFGLVDDDEDILNMAHLGSYRDCLRYKETLAPVYKSEQAINKLADGLFCGVTLKEEIERILAIPAKRFVGHPVHYILTVDDDELRDNIVNLITGTLYKAKRLKSRRIDFLESANIYEPMDGEIVNSISMGVAKKLFDSIPGGTIVIQPGPIDYETETISYEAANVDDLAKLIKEHHRDCLTFLVFKKTEQKSKEKLKSALSDYKFVEIDEDAFNQEKAIDILKSKAKADKIVNTKSLLAKISENEDKAYYISDVNKIYNTWLDERLGTEVFTQYQNIKYPEKKINKNVGNAYDTLQSLIGLKSAKSIINEALDFNKVQKLYSEQGFDELKPARHMVFTGNPGTAKTTVARLFAQIMKDNKVLPNGKLIEVGRKDLVGKYVGWTAKHVEDAFHSAMGSVLFIDEAYSLCEERDGLYGDEAINTIVQMMENQRDDTIVIFAGYPDKMQKFLDKNPGLRSRIAFHVNFDDYNEDELVEILKLMAKENKVSLSDDVENKVREILVRAIKEKDFGNGRFVRNLFERARMRQASRIVSMDQSSVDESVLTTLVADDFIMPDELLNKKDTNKAIGFVA